MNREHGRFLMDVQNHTLIKMTALTAAGTVLLSSLVSADKAEIIDIYDLSLADLLNVRISGVSLREQQVIDAPASISVFDDYTIKKLGVTTLVELTRFVPGFQTFRTDEGNNFSISARGRMGGTASREILLIIDGVRLESWWTGASFYNFSPLSLEGVKKVEFIRGPVSQIYGSNAFTGVINIETGQQQGSASVQVGNLEYVRVATSLHFSRGEHDHFINFDGFSDEGQTYQVTDPFDASERVQVSDPKRYLNASYRWTSRQWSAKFMLMESYTDEFYAAGGVNEDYTTSDFRHVHLNVQHDKTWDTNFTTHLSVGYKNLNNWLEIPFTGEGAFAEMSEPPSEAPLAGYAEENSYEYWLDGHMLYETAWNLDIQSGFEVRNKHVDDVLGVANFDILAILNEDFPVASSPQHEFPLVIGPAADDTLLGLFSTFTYRLSDLELSLGARYDDYDIAGTQFTPRASAVFKLTPQHAFKLIYGEAFRSPTHIELFTVNNLNILGNDRLIPETVKTTEFIWLHDTDHRRIQFGWFENQFENTIGFDVALDGVRQVVNLGESHSEGLEFEWAESFTSRWTARLMASRLFEKPEDMFRLTDDTANVMVTYSQRPWAVSADVAYSGEREYLHRDGGIRNIASYSLLNVHLNYRFRSDLDLSLTALNALDKDYYGPSASISTSAIPARGIEVKLGLAYRF